MAPAALGLLASGANSAELSVNGVADCASSSYRVTSVAQFSDVYHRLGLQALAVG